VAGAPPISSPTRAPGPTVALHHGDSPWPRQT
jgi:hypothetical protein